MINRLPIIGHIIERTLSVGVGKVPALPAVRNTTGDCPFSALQVLEELQLPVITGSPVPLRIRRQGNKRRFVAQGIGGQWILITLVGMGRTYSPTPTSVKTPAPGSIP